MAARALFSMSGGIAVMPWAFRACSAAFAMTSFSSLPCATKLQVFIPMSEHFSSFAMSGLLRSDVLRLRASSRVGSTESKFHEHERRRFVLGRRCVSVAINFVSLWREDGYLEGEHLPVRQEGMTIVTRYLSRSSVEHVARHVWSAGHVAE